MELERRSLMDTAQEGGTNRQERMRPMYDTGHYPQEYYEGTGLRRRSSEYSPSMRPTLVLTVQPVQWPFGPGCRGAFDVHGQGAFEGRAGVHKNAIYSHNL